MYISKEVRDLLRQKLNYSEQQIHAINDDLGHSAKVLGFVQIIQSKKIGRNEKLSALDGLQKFRQNISTNHSVKNLINKAYDDFYSFKKYK